MSGTDTVLDVQHKHGDLVVWWIPQVPMKSFEVPVRNVREAKLLLNTLAEYDIFQFENRIKPDYCNAGGLRAWDEGIEPDDDGRQWTDWESENGEDIDDVTDPDTVRWVGEI